jgi:hypothetical protein
VIIKKTQAQLEYIAELCILQSLPTNFKIIKPKRMRWVGNIAHITEIINACEILVGKPQEKKLLEVLRAEGRKILKWISKNYIQGLD